MKNAAALRGMKACALLLVASLAFAPLQVFACGKERWPVKTVTDKDAAKVQEAPTPGTINQLHPILQVVLHDHKSIQDFKKANRAKREEQ